MNGITKGTIARTIILALALINQLLTALGYQPLQIDDALIENIVAAVFTIIAAVWAWWKNNSFTKTAKKADELAVAMSEGKHFDEIDPETKLNEEN